MAKNPKKTLRMCSECQDLLRGLGAPVRYIVLPSHAYEHKVFVPPFQRRFPAAQVFVSPECALSPSTVVAQSPPVTNMPAACWQQSKPWL
jgi:hypothetical protein